MNTSGFRLLLALCCFAFGSLLPAQNIPYEELKDIRRQIEACQPLDGIDKGLLPNYDGPINIEKWYRPNTRSLPSPYRIMFVLKEPWGEGGRDLSKECNDMQRLPYDGKSTYKPMVVIANMIVKGRQDYDGMATLAEQEEGFSIFKESSGIMEVSKFSGGTNSNNYEIAQYAEQNMQLLSRQIEVYKPNIVIIGVGKFASDRIVKKSPSGNYIIFGKEQMAIPIMLKYPVSDYCCAYKTAECLYVVTYHPNARVKKDKYCEAIYIAVQDWIGNRKIK